MARLSPEQRVSVAYLTAARGAAGSVVGILLRRRECLHPDVVAVRPVRRRAAAAAASASASATAATSAPALHRLESTARLRLSEHCGRLDVRDELPPHCALLHHAPQHFSFLARASLRRFGRSIALDRLREHAADSGDARRRTARLGRCRVRPACAVDAAARVLVARRRRGAAFVAWRRARRRARRRGGVRRRVLRRRRGRLVGRIVAGHADGAALALALADPDRGELAPQRGDLLARELCEVGALVDPDGVERSRVLPRSRGCRRRETVTEG